MDLKTESWGPQRLADILQSVEPIFIAMEQTTPLLYLTLTCQPGFHTVNNDGGVINSIKHHGQV